MAITVTHVLGMTMVGQRGTSGPNSPVDHVHRFTDGLPEGVLQNKTSLDQLEKVVTYNVHPQRKNETGGDPIHDITQNAFMALATEWV